MTIYGDYGKNLNNNNINFNTDKKAGQAKPAETAKETIDVTGAKYRGESKKIRWSCISTGIKYCIR